MNIFSFEVLQKILGDEDLQKLIDNGNSILASRNEINDEKKEFEALLAFSDKMLQDAISSGDSNSIAIEREINDQIKKRIDAANEVLERTKLAASMAKELNQKMVISKLLRGGNQHE